MVALSRFIRFHARRTPQRLALIYGDDRIDYAELTHRIETSGGWLAARGIGHGDVVALLMKNSPAFIELTFATSHLGAVSLPINYRLAADEVGYIAENAAVRLLLCDEEIAAAAAGLPNVVVVDAQAQRDSRRLAPASPVPVGMHAARPDDLFRLMYTSGTTDRPKGVIHTYSNFFWKCADHIAALGLDADDRLLIAGPLYRAALSCRRLRPAGCRRAVGGRHARHPARFRCVQRACPDRSGAADGGLAGAAYAGCASRPSQRP